MSKRVFSIVLVIMAMVLLLSACRLPASSAPNTTATAEGELPFPVASTSDLVNQILFATQTAIAAGGNPVVGTPQPAESQAGGGAPTVQEATANPGGGGQPGGDQTGGGVATTAPQAQQSQSGGGAPAAQPTAAPNYTLPPAPARPATYTIQRGEYPYCIARRYDINAGSLLAANGLGVNSHVSVGFTLTIPATGNWSTGSRSLHAHPTTFTARSGDTLNSIACYFGDVYPEFIAAANGMSASAVPTAGQVLQIP